jgi:hypothetical protein
LPRALTAGTIQALVRLGGTTRIGVALLLLAVVAGASTAQIDGGRALSAPELAFLVMLVAVVAALAIAVGTVALSGGAFVSGDRRRKGATAMPLVLLLATLAALLFMTQDEEIERLRRPGDDRRSRDAPTDDFFGLGGGDMFATIAVGVMASIALLAALLFVVGVRQRRRQAVELPPEEEEAMMQALDESLDDLRRERDVRRAIIACYARMERALEYAGSARRPAEAPLEYLVRILERITTNGRAARSLTELFERAKFGTEPMGEGEKQQAIEALELLRAELLQSQ